MSGSIGTPKQSLQSSPLFSTCVLFRDGRNSGASSRKGQRALAAPLMLTALVDAFSILVIFLLVQFSPEPNEFEVDGRMMLPIAQTAEPKTGSDLIVVRFVRESWWLGDERFESVDQLTQRLLAQSASRVVIAVGAQESFDSIGAAISNLSRLGRWTVEIAVEKSESIDGRRLAEVHSDSSFKKKLTVQARSQGRSR